MVLTEQELVELVVSGMLLRLDQDRWVVEGPWNVQTVVRLEDQRETQREPVSRARSGKIKMNYHVNSKIGACKRRGESWK